jgi:hypothetical protein
VAHRNVRVIRAYETDTVEIQWTCKTGETWYERRTCPPKATRDAQTTATPQTSLDVVGTTGGKVTTEVLTPGTESRSIEEVLPPETKQAIDQAKEKDPGAVD